MAFSLFGKSAETPTLQLYGKLPIAKDYLRIACAEGAALELRSWLDQTFGAVRENEKRLRLHEPLRFVLGGKEHGSAEPLQGILWPSSDAGGHRAFPFALCVTRRSKRFAEDMESGLAQGEGLWRSLAEVYNECQAAPDGRDLLQTQRGRDVPVESDGLESVNTADVDAWIETLWPEAGVSGVRQILREIQALAKSGEPGPFRLPLVRVLPVRDQVLAWRGILIRLGALPDGDPGICFFPGAALIPSLDPACLVIGAGPLTDKWAQWLTEDFGPAALGPADFCAEIFADVEAGERMLDLDLDAVAEDAAPLLSSLGEILTKMTERHDD